MFTRKALNNYINNFLHEIKQRGYSPSRVILFGSYAYGRPHALSDIDLAVWDTKFTGCSTVDVEPIVEVLSKFPGLELHTFSLEDDAENNPFAERIIKTGTSILEQ